MKSKKNNPPEPINSEDNEIEERVRKMLDPSEPDPVPEKPAFEIIPETEPGTAPEVSEDSEPLKAPIVISIKEHTDEDEEPKQDEQATEEPDESTEEPAAETEEPVEDSSEELSDEEDKAEEAEEEPSEPETEQPEEESSEDTGESEETAAPEEDKSESDSIIDDPATAAAVADIVATESDQLLAAEDEKLAAAFDDKKPKLVTRIKNFFVAWWHNRIARRATIAVLLLTIAVTLTVPDSRYFVLNSLGVRSSASVTVLDESTGLPLRNVHVSISGQASLTDDEGKVFLSRLKLGKNDLVIEKRAFATNSRKVVLGWGSNPLGEFNLKPVGIQYSFTLTDFLSGKPIEKAEAISGEASAFSDHEGKIKLTIDKTDDSPVEVVIKAADYRDEDVSLTASHKDDTEVIMAPARRHAFISKRSGKYDVYKVYADGKHEERVLAGTGNERDDMVLAPHPTAEIVALVSSREGVRNRDGFMLSTLTLINLETNDTISVTRSERVQIVDWVGSRLVYVQITSGASAANPKRHRLMSYDVQTAENKELASSNYFNSVLSADGNVYYAPSSAYQKSPVALYRIDANGENRHKILEQEVWNILRTEYGRLTLAATNRDWYAYQIGSGQRPEVLDGEPSTLRSRLYVNSPDGQSSLWVDHRDGKGVLLSYNLGTNQDKELLTRSGLKSPVRWLSNNSVMFRISTEQETADYALSLNGGEAKKVRDVTDTSGVEDWYYY